MLRIKFLLGAILAFTAWIHPAYAISAFAEQPQDNPTFINYEKFRKPIQPIFGSNAEPATTKTLHQKGSAAIKSRPAINNGQSIQYSGRYYSKEEVQELIKSYSAQYGIKPDAPLCIAKLESGYNQFSKNKSSSASGVFQYLNSTWKATDEGKIGLSVFDPDANIKAAIKYMASRKSAKPWTVHTKCPPIQLTNQNDKIPSNLEQIR